MFQKKLYPCSILYTRQVRVTAINGEQSVKCHSSLTFSLAFRTSCSLPRHTKSRKSTVEGSVTVDNLSIVNVISGQLSVHAALVIACLSSCFSVSCGSSADELDTGLSRDAVCFSGDWRLDPAHFGCDIWDRAGNKRSMAPGASSHFPRGIRTSCPATR